MAKGGAREGAGRPATGRLKIFANMTISGTPEEIEEIKRLAKESGKSASRFIIDEILKK